MPTDDFRISVELLLRDFSAFTHDLGGLEFYGYSSEFQDLLHLCHDFALTPRSETRKTYLFLDNFHGKSSLAKAISIQAVANGGAAFRFDGTIGLTSKELKDLQKQIDALVIVDGDV